MKGAKIKTVEALERASENKRSVIGSGPFTNPKPAIVALNMACSVVLANIRSGLFIYEKCNK